MKGLRFLFPTIILIFTACILFGDPYIYKAENIPLLTADKNIGTIIGFNPSYPEQKLDSFEVAWNELIDARLSIGRIQMDWGELEQTAGN